MVPDELRISPVSRPSGPRRMVPGGGRSLVALTGRMRFLIRPR